MRLDRVVEQRLVLVLEQLRVIGRADSPGEPIVVVGRQAHHRQDLAGLGVHRDHDAPCHPDLLHRPFQGLLGVPLRLRVDRQREGRARLGVLDGLEGLRSTTGRVAGHALGAVGAAELCLVLGLETNLSEQVVGLVALRAKVGQLLG
jgi:hypothetical protein